MAARLLFCTRTTDYRHDSIPDAVAVVRALGTRSSSSAPPAAMCRTTANSSAPAGVVRRRRDGRDGSMRDVSPVNPFHHWGE
ncbi:hypothetical protein [Streptomyces sp. NPDC002078]